MGDMKEALLGVVEYAFWVMKLRVLGTYTEENNIKSIKLLKGCKLIEANRVEEEGCCNNRTLYRQENNIQ